MIDVRLAFLFEPSSFLAIYPFEYFISMYSCFRMIRDADLDEYELLIIISHGNDWILFSDLLTHDM
jgi:hypothetical protein